MSAETAQNTPLRGLGNAASANLRCRHLRKLFFVGVLAIGVMVLNNRDLGLPSFFEGAKELPGMSGGDSKAAHIKPLLPTVDIDGSHLDDENMWFRQRVDALIQERDVAARQFRNGQGFLWHYHNQKGGGTALCGLLQQALHEKHSACYLEQRSSDPWAPPSRLDTCLADTARWREEWKVNGTKSFQDVEQRLILIENKMRQRRYRLVGSEKSFIPRPILREWIVNGNSTYARLFQNWTFVVNLRHPVDRFESAFYFHSWFQWCRDKHNLDYCIHNTTLFSRGMHRNKVVKELSGFYAASETGGCFGQPADVRQANNSLPVHASTNPLEATREDLALAKLVLARFIPPVFFDSSDILNRTYHSAASYLGTENGRDLPWKAPRDKPNVTERVRHWIERHNNLDIELYQFALTKLSQI